MHAHAIYTWIYLLRYLHTNEECPWLCGAVEVARIAELALVQISLETVEDVLYATIELQIYVVVQDECIARLEVKVKEIGGCLHAVVLDISCIVWHNHRACICS